MGHLTDILGARFSAYLENRRWPRAVLLKSVGLVLTSDPLAESIAQGRAAGAGGRRPTRQVRLQARSIRDRVRANGGHRAAIPELLDLIRTYPSIEEFQKITARILNEGGDRGSALQAWLGISLRFPRAMDAFHNLALLTLRENGPEAVAVLLRARFSRMPTKLDQLLAYAEACDLAGAAVDRRAAFGRLARIFAKRSDAWLTTSSWLEEELVVSRAAVSLVRQFVAGTALAPPIIRRRAHLQTAVGEWEPLESGGKETAASIRVLGALFEQLIQVRRVGVWHQPSSTGPALLLTGSLGAGGAERQLVTTAIGLNRIGLGEQPLGDGSFVDKIGVVARSLRGRRDGSFFVGDLDQAGVPVRSYRELPDFAGDLSTSAVRPALSALGYLPWSTAEAVIKLTDWLRHQKPQVVHIWQDGLVYAAGLAALLAGVPRVVLSGRSMPPPDRSENYLVEYDIIYRSLLRAPGVKLSVNSYHASSRYASWLKIDPEQIAVIHNGVAPLSREADPSSDDLWRAFEGRTGRSGLTLGAVMRLDEVKRPLLWIEAAASVLAKLPDARFVIVGDGPFRTRAELKAVALGIAGRCLFVGRSQRVGYWLTKMDALMLLSEHEGLPNAVIEAQLAGVPVLATAVGGTPEALVAGVTGIVTDPHPDPRDIADLIAGLAARPEQLRRMGVEAARWASQAFPIAKMLSSTLDTYSAAGRIARGGQAEPQEPAGLRLQYAD